MSTKFCKATFEQKTVPSIERYRIVLKHYPPIFYKWFLSTFPEPSSWFSARVSYARTAAVMSMIGSIMGLGDRHGENILFDSTTGDCIHVDFNCLFWKGLTFEKPEKVPFRLTPNMVDAMGISGHLGVFRRVCEITLSVLRNNKDTLMSVLETFIYDPLVEWSKREDHKREDHNRDTTSNLGFGSGEVENSSAVNTVSEIEMRLLGKVGVLLPISVEGQVHQLIEEAVSPENLSQMYIGWSSWL